MSTKTLFQGKSYLQVLGVRSRTYLFWSWHSTRALDQMNSSPGSVLKVSDAKMTKGNYLYNMENIGKKVGKKNISTPRRKWTIRTNNRKTLQVISRYAWKFCLPHVRELQTETDLIFVWSKKTQTQCLQGCGETRIYTRTHHLFPGTGLRQALTILNCWCVY